MYSITLMSFDITYVQIKFNILFEQITCIGLSHWKSCAFTFKLFGNDNGNHVRSVTHLNSIQFHENYKSLRKRLSVHAQPGHNFFFSFNEHTYLIDFLLILRLDLSWKYILAVNSLIKNEADAKKVWSYIE